MHKNNFDFLRLLFAVLVIITHSYVLSGSSAHDLLYHWTGGQMTCSGLGVYGFFTISGYLICQSAMNSRNILDYTAKRILRIYPGFIVVLLMGILAGWLVTTYGTGTYFHQASTWSYFTRNIAMILRPQQFEIAGVFQANPNHGINGSLWTIPYELFFYIILATLFLLRRFGKLSMIFTALTFAACFAWKMMHPAASEHWLPSINLEVHQLAQFGCYFMAGSLLAAVNVAQFRYKIPVLLLLCVLLYFSIPAGLFYYAQYLVLPVVIILFGIMCTPGLAGWNNRIGDLSYGIYLYAFLIQQLLVHYFRPGYFILTCITIPLAALCALGSWNLVEKKAMSLKQYLKPRKARK